MNHVYKFKALLDNRRRGREAMYEKVCNGPGAVLFYSPSQILPHFEGQAVDG